MAKDFNLSAQLIYEKEFQVDMKGYSTAQVDELLDLIIEDYQMYDEKIEELGQAVTRYEAKINELREKISALQSQNKSLTEHANSKAVAGNSDQIDILKRIARLEEAVFSNSSVEEADIFVEEE